jgi:putative GTP pyrophosphokinase
MPLTRAQIESLHAREFEVHARATVRLKELLALLLRDLSPLHSVRDGFQISGEPKEQRSFCDKALKRRPDSPDRCLEIVRDFARARVVVQTLDDVKGLVSLLDTQESIAVDWTSVQNYIEDPQERGSRGYHVDVSVDVPDGQRKRLIVCELQIRTAIQEAWGGFSHKDFYKGRTVPPVYEEQMEEMAALLAAVDKMAASLIRNLATDTESRRPPRRPRRRVSRARRRAPK